MVTYQTEARTSGSEPWQWIEFEVDRCTLEFGVTCPAVLGAGGQKCFNSFRTCPVRNSFTPEPYWLRFCEPRATVPLRFPFEDDGHPFFFPFLRGVSHSPVKVDPGVSIGVRAEIKVTIDDAPHHDWGIDPYVDERGYNPLDRGLALAKLRERFPFFIGRRLRWYEGFLINDSAAVIGAPQYWGETSTDIDAAGFGDEVALTGDEALVDSEPFSVVINFGQSTLYFVRRDYVIEKFDGPDADGKLTIVAKDPLKLADADRAQDPRPSTGVLAESLEEEDDPEYIDVVTGNEDEYSDTRPGIVFIGSEGIQYEFAFPFSPGVVRLQWVTRGLPDDYETERSSHAAGDLVQQASYRRGRVIDVVRALLIERVPNFDPEWIPWERWQAEHDTWLGGTQIRRLIHEPTGVVDLINEIVEQTLTWGFWWDEERHSIEYRAIRPADVDDITRPLSDMANIVAGSMKRVDEADRLWNEVQVLYGQRNPTVRRDQVDNYRRGNVDINVDSQSGFGDAVRRTHRIYARWHGVENATRVAQFLKRTLQARAQVPVRLEFELHRKDGEIHLAEFVDLTTLWVIDEFGLPRTMRAQVVRVMSGEDTLKYTVREDFFAGQFRRIAPAALAGLQWSDASEDQRERYVFIADAGGLMSDGSEGARLL